MFGLSQVEAGIDKLPSMTGTMPAINSVKSKLIWDTANPGSPVTVTTSCY